ncbi:hypothetical protein K445DRAFT_253302 [Daldinia sp. EC12]|nr:hypothetical protein K445DRAFT_253302 [Daldinia sp. EC12]
MDFQTAKQSRSVPTGTGVLHSFIPHPSPLILTDFPRRQLLSSPCQSRGCPSAECGHQTS